MNVYMVSWRYRSTPYVIDFDDEAMALKAAIDLAEGSRIEIAITKVDYEPDPEVKARIWQRIQDRMAMEWAITAATA